MARLSRATLAAARDACVPTYDRTRPPTVVHLGVGAFARAHLAVYADDLLAAGWSAAIHGVSLLSPQAEAQLAPQDGLFTVVVREPSGTPPPRIVGSITSVSTGPAAAIAAIAAARKATTRATGVRDAGGRRLRSDFHSPVRTNQRQLSR